MIIRDWKYFAKDFELSRFDCIFNTFSALHIVGKQEYEYFVLISMIAIGNFLDCW